MAKVVPTSFKENERDKKLYSIVIKQSDKSAFIKDAIEFFVDCKGNKSSIKMENYPEIIKCDEEDDEILGIISAK